MRQETRTRLSETERQAIEDKTTLANFGEVVRLPASYQHLSQFMTGGDTAQRGRAARGGDAAPDCGSDKPVVLTSRQREVLSWIAAGKTLRDVALITGLSYATVRHHIDAARKRYGFATTQQTIVRAAQDYGFDPLGPT